MEVIRELDADIIALQEADKRLGDRPATLGADRLFEATGMRMAQFAGGGRSSGWHGNAILLKEGIVIHETVCVDLPSFEPRGALVAEVVVGDIELRIVGVHLGLRSADRRRQSRALVDLLNKRGNGKATVILGDLNEWRVQGAAVAELSKTHQVSPPLRSFHSRTPMAPLDRIFVGPQFRITKVMAHRSISSRWASDHLPVWADIELVSADSDVEQRAMRAVSSSSSV